MRTFITIGVALMTLAAGIVFSTTAVRALWFGDSQIHTPETIQREVTRGSAPVRLVIPRIGVDAYVEDVGITPAGNMATPEDFSNVGWYRYGPSPGDRGSAVVAGHVDNGMGRAGVFADLNRLEPGDRVEVHAEDGNIRTFEVTSVRTYPYTEVPTDILFNPSGTERLNLVTCEGEWMSQSRTYDERLVVFTKLVP